MSDAGKDEKGRFATGNKYGQGRPPKARETALLLVAYEICNTDAWRQIFSRQVLDALGKKRITDASGKAAIIDDPDSTPASRAKAFTNVRDTCIGRPTEYVRLNDDADPYAQFTAYTDAELAQILNTIERLRRDSGGGELDTGGTSAAGQPDGDGGSI